MNKKQYVTFEVAKLLKEKGFDWFTYAYYTKDDVDKKPYFGIENLCPDNWNGQVGEVNDLWFSAPTHQMAVCWLTEEKGMYISVVPDFNEYGKYPDDLYWFARVYDLRNGDYIHSTKLYKSSQETFEVALKYVLTNLI